MSFLEVRHPFFRPMWRRIVVVTVVLGWALFELVSGAGFWAVLFGAAGIYLCWAFFVAFEDGPVTGQDSDEEKDRQ